MTPPIVACSSLTPSFSRIAGSSVLAGAATREENARCKNCKVSQENDRCYETKGIFTRRIPKFSWIIPSPLETLNRALDAPVAVRIDRPPKRGDFRLSKPG